MAAQLESLTAVPSITLDKPVIFIGRDRECDVVLTDSRRVSRKHCCLAIVNDQLVVRDLGSMNGIYVNGQRVERTRTMRPGDELAIGDVRFRFVNEDAPASGPDVSQDIPVAVSEPGGELLVAEPASVVDLPELPDLRHAEIDDDDVIPLGDDD
jgi:pSer/pThr/pTyr-binding forkhead associated (FHA) protein